MSEENNQGFQLQINVEELRNKKLFVATPMYGNSASL